jgi:hypothetical protein
MWTPRRIFLTLIGLLGFASIYLGYARLLGSFDGLPPLPAHYLPSDGPRPPAPLPTGNTLDRKMELAFGPGCNELRYPIKLDLKAKGVLVAAYAFRIIPPGDPRAGWVEFAPLSVAMFGEKRGPDGVPEINTLYADVAYLKFDRPIRAMGDLDGRKVVAAELHANPDSGFPGDNRKGRLLMVNNRRTVDPNDDVRMITSGPLYYEDLPRPGQPHIYTFTPVEITDHLNTALAEPDHTAARLPTMTGVGLRVFLTPEDKAKKQPAKDTDPRLPIPRKDKPGLTGVDLVELDNTVELNLWTDASASFVAPGSDPTAPKKKPADPKKDAPPPEKRLLQVRTNGPFRYDPARELAHFERPAAPRPGLVEDQHVTVTRAGRTVGQDMLDCEYLDVQFMRKPPPGPPKDGTPPKPASPPDAKKDATPGDGDLSIKSIRAWGETVVITSDSELLHATGVEMIHEAEARTTVLRGDARQPVQAVKDGNLLRGSELHLFGDGKEISQAHVLGAGSFGFGDFDPKTGDYQKLATWTDRLVYTKQTEKDKPPVEILTFLGKNGGKAVFKDTSSGELKTIEAHQLKVWLAPKDPPKDGKTPPAKKEEPKKEVKKGDPKKDAGKPDVTKSAKPMRMEAVGEVRSTSPEVIVRHTDYLNIWFQDVPKLVKPPKTDPKDAPGKATSELPPPREVTKETAKVIPEPGPKPHELPRKGPDGKEVASAKKDEPAKKPMVVVARTIEVWMNRDPQGQNEVDRVRAEGEVEVHQDPAREGELGTDVAGQTVDMKTYAEGNLLAVTGDATDRGKPKWGVVRFDKVTMFGFDIVIDQRSNAARVKGEGSMEILTASDMEGKKLEKPTTMYVHWNHKMDFLGPDKLVYYHGDVHAYQEASKLKCQWMQVVLDRPVFLNQAAKPKTPAKPKAPGDKKADDKKAEDDSPKIDMVTCHNTPMDEDVPRPKKEQPVTVIEEVKENGKLVRWQSIEAPDVQAVNTPGQNPGEKTRHDVTAIATNTAPGVVRIWQPGPKDALAENAPVKDGAKKDAAAKKDAPARKKGELSPDEEMKLTIVQFGGKMIANDFRKRAKFWTNVRAVHLAAEKPTVVVDIREGEIPVGAVYLEARDWLDVSTTTQRERDKDGKEVDRSYQEMVAQGNVRVRKQGEFFGDADRVTYSELKGTLTFHGTDKNPAVVTRIRGQGIPGQPQSATTIIYFVKTKTFEFSNATGLAN